MKVSTKIVTVALLACAFCLVLAGCSAGPSSAVDSALKAIKGQNVEALQKVCIPDVSTDTIITKGAAPEINGVELTDEQKAVFDSYASKLLDFDYSIKSEKVEGDKATVEVTFKTYDFAPVVTGWMNDFYTQALTTAFANLGASQDVLQQKMAGILVDTLQARLPLLGEKTLETTGTFECQKTNEGWKLVELSKDARNAMLGGSPAALESAQDKMNSRLG